MPDEGVKYPNIEVQLTGKDGNAFSIIGSVRNALRDNGVPKNEVDNFLNAAYASENYNALLQLCMQWVKVS